MVSVCHFKPFSKTATPFEFLPPWAFFQDSAKFSRPSFFNWPRKRRYLGRYFAHPMMQNRRAKRDDYKPSAVRVTQRYVP
ncbi:hypothetical protein [Piscirickettsia salmonis]|uniref:hypothetical protein n=1 Tax=Piscirickettsia salmonis TaxID=1238 RepID=UPI00094B579E|nr:hypothetical protein [Piscirickettsia salmonis]